jgi:ribosomal protein S14
LRPNSRVTGDKKKAGIIRKYGLNMSRQAFREKAAEIGFQKVGGVSLISGKRCMEI